MASLIPGYEYDIFISYRPKKEGRKRRMEEGGNGRKGEGEKRR